MMCMSEENQKFSAFFQMITLAASGASGMRIHLSDDIEWQKVIQYAQEQGVLSLIGCIGCLSIHCISSAAVCLRSRSGQIRRSCRRKQSSG